LTAPFLDEQKSQADGVEQALRPTTPQTNVCLRSMREILSILDNTSVQCVMHLRATSDYQRFEDLQDLVIKVRDSTYKIIRTLGDVVRDFEPIKRAAELLDTLDIHIALSMSVEVRRQRGVSIGKDLKDLRASRTEVMMSLDRLRASTREVFARLEDKKTSR